MCGIAGFFHTNDSDYCADEITNSLIKSLYHRGPDSHGINIFFNKKSSTHVFPAGTFFNHLQW